MLQDLLSFSKQTKYSPNVVRTNKHTVGPGSSAPNIPLPLTPGLLNNPTNSKPQRWRNESCAFVYLNFFLPTVFQPCCFSSSSSKPPSPPPRPPRGLLSLLFHPTVTGKQTDKLASRTMLWGPKQSPASLSADFDCCFVRPRVSWHCVPPRQWVCA